MIPSRKKVIISMIFITTLMNGLIAEKECDWSYRPNSFKQIEIISGLGGANSILLNEHGLLCTTFDTKKNPTKFFLFKDLDFASIIELQCFLLRNSSSIKDTIIDDPNIRTTGMPVKVIIRESWNKQFFIEYVDSKNPSEFIDSLLCLSNNIIPRKERNAYSIGRYCKW
jgi:hypothetical protein